MYIKEVIERDRSCVPEYEWDRFTYATRFGFAPLLANTSWVGLTRGERDKVYYCAESRWEDSKAEDSDTRYQIKMTAVRLSNDGMRVIIVGNQLRIKMRA